MADTVDGRVHGAASALVVQQAKWYEIPEYWPQVVDGVEKALRGRSIQLDANVVRTRLLCKAMVLWVAVTGEGEVRGCAVTEINDYPLCRVLNFLTISGVEFAEWSHFEEAIERFARSNGCHAIEGCGRAGWKKLRPDYKPVYTIFRKMLT